MADCIDTQLLIWGIGRKATPNRREMIERAAHFFRERARTKDKIILPAIALAEFLVDYDENKRILTLAEIGKGFIVWSFDAKAAAIATELQANWDMLKGVGRENGLTRQTIKADIQIIATAVSAGATCLYSEDSHMEAFAQRRITVKSLPSVPPRRPQPRTFPGFDDQ